MLQPSFYVSPAVLLGFLLPVYLEDLSLPRAGPRELKVASVTIHLVTPRMSCDQWRFPFVIGVITEVGSKFGSKVSFFCASWVLPSYCPLQLLEGGRCDRDRLGVEECLTFLLSKRHIPLCLFSVTAREADIPPALPHAGTCRLSTGNAMQLSRQFFVPQLLWWIA